MRIIDQSRLNRRRFVKTVGTVTGLATGWACGDDFSFQSNWEGSRIWVGPEYWANPLQDWRIEDGEVIARAGAGRTLHLLTHQVGEAGGGFQMETTARLVNKTEAATETWAGFVFGVRGPLPGYQQALVHPRTLIDCGVRGDGRIFAGDAEGGALPMDAPIRLKLTVSPSGSNYDVELSGQSKRGGELVTVTQIVESSRLPGNVALAAQAPGRAGPENTGVEWAFSDWRLRGSQLEEHSEQTFGPILWTQYALSRGTLKVMAHFPPIGSEDPQTARLEKHEGGAWATVGSAAIDPLSRRALFRIEDWDESRDIEYRVVYAWRGEDCYWGGVIRKDPNEKEQLRVGVFSCDHGEVFPQRRLVRNVAIQDPDIVFFAGDQIYESYGGFGVARGKPAGEAMLDYLRKYWQFGWTWRSILKDRPSIIIPDDHDVFQGNIWGQSGRTLPVSPDGQGFENGGFLMDVDWVNAVQRTQSGHLPDPVDARPCDSGIEVCFTELCWGGASFAVIEDRKFKTGPGDVLSAQQRAVGRRDPAVVDVDNAEMLGPRQEEFLRRWVGESSDVDFRIVCSQTIFCKATTHSGAMLRRSLIDLDCGGWPQKARNRALGILSAAAGVIMLHGDQHIGSLVKHGIDDWEDGPLAFMVPGTSNGFPRAWRPDAAGENPVVGAPVWTGRYRDGLGNRMTVLGAANPDPDSNTKEGQAGMNPEEIAHRKGSGHGVLVLDRKTLVATFNMWRHAFDAKRPADDDQFPGFPISIALT